MQYVFLFYKLVILFKLYVSMTIECIHEDY